LELNMTKSDAGKGDDWRLNFDYNKFWTNFDLISSTPMTVKKPKYKKVIVKKGKTTYVF